MSFPHTPISLSLPPIPPSFLPYICTFGLRAENSGSGVCRRSYSQEILSPGRKTHVHLSNHVGQLTIFLKKFPQEVDTNSPFWWYAFDLKCVLKCVCREGSGWKTQHRRHRCGLHILVLSPQWVYCWAVKSRAESGEAQGLELMSLTMTKWAGQSLQP